MAPISEIQKGDASFSGIVVDKQGKPLSGMNIVSGNAISARPFSPTVSDAEGKFSASELMSGEYAIMAIPAFSEGTGIDSGHQKVTLNPGESVTGIRLVYPGASERTISGTVKDARGVPIVGASINGTDVFASITFYSHAETDHDGRFVLEGRERVRCDVSVTHPDYTTSNFSRLEVGQNDLEIVLEGRGTITGQVVDAVTGKPVTQFEAGSGVRWGRAMRSVRSLEYKAFENAEGRFTLSSVDVGEVNVYVRAPGYAPIRLEVPTLRSDEIRDLSVVRLTNGASLEGTVTDMKGTPVSRALILLSGEVRDHCMYPPYLSTSRHFGEEYHAMTDELGRFVINSLSPELTKIELKHADYPRTVGTIALTMGQKTSANLVMTGFATVEGTLYVNGEKAGAGNSVHVQNESMKVPRSAETDENGFYRVEEVPEGIMRVQAGTSEGGSLRSVEVEASTTLGNTTVLDLYVEFGTATIVGTVTTNGASTQRLSIGANEIGGEDHAGGMVSPDGTYQISGLKGGEYQICVADVLSGEPSILGIARGTVAAGETTTVDIVCDTDVDAPKGE